VSGSSAISAGARRQRARQHDACAFAAGEFGDGAVREMRRVSVAQGGGDRGFVGRRDARERSEMRQPAEPDEPCHRQRPMHRIGLRQIGHLPRKHTDGEAGNIGTVERHRARCGREQTEQGARERRLAGTVRADHADQRAAAKRHADIVEHAPAAEDD
jgi:hypothetical protein